MKAFFLSRMWRWWAIGGCLLGLLVLASTCVSPSAPPTISPSPIALAPILPPATPTPLPYPPPPPPAVPALPPYPLPPTPTPGTPPPTFTPVPTWTPYPLPRITHDLLFLGKFSLMRWNHTTGQIEALVTPEARRGESWQGDRNVAWAAAGGGPIGAVWLFSVSADGRKVALVRSKAGAQPGDITGTELALLDVPSHQITVLIPAQVWSPWSMAISPDGKWVAYISSGPQPATPTPVDGARSGLAAPPARPAAGGGPTSGRIYAVRTDTPGHPVEIGYCGTRQGPEQGWGCLGFYWSPDSHAIAWNDSFGVGLAELGQPGRLVVANQPLHPNSRLVQLQNWSPLGRFALVGIAPEGTEGGSWGVMDMSTGRITDMPDSYQAWGSPVARATWMQDGRSFVVRSADESGKRIPTGEIWRIDPAHDPMLSREADFPLGVGLENYATSPLQLEDGRLAFAVINTSDTNYLERGLYFVDLSDRLPHRMAGLPPSGRGREGAFTILDTTVHWAPDGTSAIVEYRDFAPDRTSWYRLLWFVPTDGSPLVDLRPIMDESEIQACCFVWTK